MAGGSAEGRSVQGPGMALYLVQGTWNWPEGWKGNGEVEGQPGDVGSTCSPLLAAVVMVMVL